MSAREGGCCSRCWPAARLSAAGLPEVLAQRLYDSRPRLPDGLVPDGVRSLATALLHRAPLLRPTAAEAREILAQFAG